MHLLFCPWLFPIFFGFALSNRSRGDTRHMMLEKGEVQKGKNLARKPHV
jgi:hypothetical protein